MMLALFIVWAIKGSIVLMVFALGMQSSFRDAAYLFRTPRLLLRSVFSISIVMPVFVVAVAMWLDIHPGIKLALVALALSPVPPVLPRKQGKAGGDANYAIALLFSAALFAVVLVPLSVEIVGALVDRDVHIEWTSVAGIMLLTVLVPLAAGMAVHRLAPAFADLYSRPLSRLAMVLLIAAVLPLLVMEFPLLIRMTGNGTLLALALFSLFGLAVGHWLGGPDDDKRTVLALATATRHPGVAFAIANIGAPADKSALAVVVWHLVVSAIVAIPYVRWRTRLHAERSGAAS
jgi:BASS family bile acid:Na+ symporter